MITENQRDECSALYPGEGSRFRFKGHTLSSLSATPMAAVVDLQGASAAFTANALEVLTVSAETKFSRSPADGTVAR